MIPQVYPLGWKFFIGLMVVAGAEAVRDRVLRCVTKLKKKVS